MVVFTCNHCGESVHKPKVEKHYQFQCRNFKSVTCVDCFKDFKNEEYVVHTKCLTEDERYAAKGTYKNGIIKKGEVKQESWVEMIKSICDTEENLKPSLRRLLEMISEYSNVPRKKPKFLNFIKSSSGNRVNMKEVEEVWDIIEKYKIKNAPTRHNISKNGSTVQKEEADSDLVENPKKRTHENDSNGGGSKKIKVSKDTTQMPEPDTRKKSKSKQNTEETIENLEDTEKFNYKVKILEILSKKQSISLKKLQKKILKAYLSASNQNEAEEKIIKKFNKKLKKIPNVSIQDDKVFLAA